MTDNFAAECLELLQAQAGCTDLARHDELSQASLSLLAFAIFDENEYLEFKKLNACEWSNKAAASRWQNYGKF